MVTTEVFDKLKELQDVLAEKYSLEAKIEDSPKQLSSQDELLVRLRKEFLETNDSYEKVKAEVGQLQLELDEAEKSREAGEKGMDNISTHREYEALEKQINEASAREAEIRKNLQKKDKELEAKENEITPGLDSEIVYKFQRIIQRNAEGIVAVKNGVCTGCHMILPAQFANEVREGENILFCPYCSRILFYKEIEEGEEVEDFLSMDETGSLADFDEEFRDELGEDADGEENDEESSDDDEKSIDFNE